MSENKTRENNDSVKTYVDNIDDPQRKTDALTSLDFYHDITQLQPKMWGSSIIGFGSYHYKYDSGREGDFFRAGFAPRKSSMAYYIMAKFEGFDKLLDKLGKHKMTKSCLHIKKLTDVDIDILKEVIQRSFNEMNQKYPIDVQRSY